jgi:RNA polymerase sigma-70 factor (ECF subfamily)
LHRIVHNKICDHFRRSAAQGCQSHTIEVDQTAQSPADLLTSETSMEPVSQQDLVLRQALSLIRGDFEERTWQACWRVSVEGQAPAHVAEGLGMTRHAVYKAKSRVLSRLRQELNGLIE